MDAAIIETLRKNNVPLTEQGMVDWMFEQAIHKLDLASTLQRFSTNAPKEGEVRPTTAGTLETVMRQLKNEKNVLVISSAPFIRYQKLITERQFLKQGLNIEVKGMGPNMEVEMATHPDLATKSLIAICLDNLAREAYELKTINDLKNKKNKFKIAF